MRAFNDPSGSSLQKADTIHSYKNQSTALSQGLISVNNNQVRLGVDSVNNYTTEDVGRPSVRLTSYQGFTHGLFVADFAHMPASTCGAWPACRE